MTASSSTADFLERAKGSVLSIEFKKRVLHPAEVPQYLDAFRPSLDQQTKSTQSFARLYYAAAASADNARGSVDVKTKTFGTNETSVVNERRLTTKLSEEATLVSLLQTTASTASPQVATGIDLVTRFSFAVEGRPEWIAHIDLLKSFAVNPTQLGPDELASAKALLVGVPLESMNPTAYDYVSAALVSLKSDDDPVLVSDLPALKEIAGGSATASPADAAYQDALFSLAGDIFRDAGIVERFRHRSGFKRLGANTVELSRPIYFKQVLPAIDTFYLTDKIDGVRAMLIIDETYRRSGHRRIFRGKSIRAVSDRIYTIAEYEEDMHSTTIEVDHTVLDVEMTTDGDSESYFFYCFDVIAMKSKRLSNEPFQKRLAQFPAAKGLLHRYKLGTTKEFVELTADGFGAQIAEFYSKSRKYEIDGLIFTPKGEPFYEARKKQPKPRGRQHQRRARLFNTEYANTVSFKWKPRSQLTIDFYLMRHPSKQNHYVLCSGVDSATFQRLRLRFFDGYVAPVSNNSRQYFPIQFAPNDGAFDSVWAPTVAEELEIAAAHDSLNGLVGEFAFVDESDARLERPRLLRLRLDRAADIAKGEYYGNALRYAELIWHSVQYPLTLQTLCDATGVGYFADGNTDWYRAQRAFNSFVKTTLLEKYLRPPASGEGRLLDLACGKGQDVARAIELGYGEIIAVDKDADALYELLERKYNVRFRHKDTSGNVQVRRADLEDAASDTIAALQPLQAQSVDAALCSFAIHYICHPAAPGKPDPLSEFAKLTAHFLKPGARLLITAFRGADVFALLRDRSEWALDEHGRAKYAIKREFESDSLAKLGQQIGVLLPFSGGNFYSEFLVNYEHLQEVFETHGLKLVDTEGFGPMLDAFRLANKSMYDGMTTADKEYVALYGYIIFERI